MHHTEESSEAWKGKDVILQSSHSLQRKMAFLAAECSHVFSEITGALLTATEINSQHNNNDGEKFSAVVYYCSYNA